jgi:hypothetical protein
VSIHELRDAFEKKLGAKLREHANDADEAVALRVDRWVDAITSAFRELGKQAGLEVAPIRRGVGELGWELVWGKNLSPSYEQLGATPPKELYRLELVLEVAENTLRPGVRAETAVEECCFDLSRLIWARAGAKVLVFGAHREKEPANSIDALEAGLTGVIKERDEEADCLLVALPNLEGARTAKGADAVLWTKIVSRGRAETARVTKLAELLRG